jgi:regulator of chromosome condensation
VFGNGDLGQLGLGIDQLDEISRPKLHSWFDKRILPNSPTLEDEDENLKTLDWSGKVVGSLGGKGVEWIHCGGMHSLCIDGDGREG